jgi:hypothetical protein
VQWIKEEIADYWQKLAEADAGNFTLADIDQEPSSS